MPKVEPFPDAWKDVKPQPLTDYDGDTLVKVQLKYIDIDGRETVIDDASQHKPSALCCLMCCPCLAAPRCAPERRQKYKACAVSVSFCLFIVQILYFIAALAIGGIAPLDINPMLGPCARAFFILGGLNPALAVEQWQIYRFVLPVLLHGGLLHLALNLCAEIRFGLYVERRIGAVRTCVLYLLGTIGGGLLSALWTRAGISVGASAALMAIMGCYTVEIVCKWHSSHPTERRCMLFQMLLWITLVLCMSALPFVDTGAHVGGLLVGALLGLLFFADATRWSRARQKVLMGVAGALLTVYFIITILVLFLAVELPPAPTQAQIDYCGE